MVLALSLGVVDMNCGIVEGLSRQRCLSTCRYGPCPGANEIAGHVKPNLRTDRPIESLTPGEMATEEVLEIADILCVSRGGNPRSYQHKARSSGAEGKPDPCLLAVLVDALIVGPGPNSDQIYVIAHSKDLSRHTRNTLDIDSRAHPVTSDSMSDCVCHRHPPRTRCIPSVISSQ